MPKAARSCGLRRCSSHAANGERRGRLGLLHRGGLRDRKVDQHGAREIEGGKEIEIRGEAQVVGDPGRDQAADEIARDIAGDVGGERAAGVHGAALLAQIGQHEREGGRHAQPLRDPQHREGGQVGRDRQQRGGDRQQRQADQDAQPAIDPLGEQGDCEPGHRHAHRAGIDREAHGRRRHVVGPRQRRKDRLRREQVDDREKGRQSDHDRAQQHSGGVAMHFHRRQIPKLVLPVP